MSQKRNAHAADAFSSSFQFGANPFAAFAMPGMMGMMPGMGSMPRLDMMAGSFSAPGFDAIFKGAARCNLELLGFMSRRAQAYLEIPAKLSQCRTPQDIFREQTQFWRTAVEQYMDTSHRLTAVTTQMLSTASLGNGGKAQPRKRDYISVPGLDVVPNGDGRGRGERRVA